jgi:hypothetical protein
MPPPEWRCGNWQPSGVATLRKDVLLAGEMANQLKRCNGFNAVHRENHMAPRSSFLDVKKPTMFLKIHQKINRSGAGLILSV